MTASKEILSELIFADVREIRETPNLIPGYIQTLISKSRFTFCKDEIFFYMESKVKK